MKILKNAIKFDVRIKFYFNLPKKSLKMKKMMNVVSSLLKFILMKITRLVEVTEFKRKLKLKFFFAYPMNDKRREA